MPRRRIGPGAGARHPSRARASRRFFGARLRFVPPIAGSRHGCSVHDPYLTLAVAEGFGESPIPPLLAPGLDPAALLADPPLPPAVPPRAAARLRLPDLAARAAAIRERAHGAGCTILTPASPAWPERLAQAPLRPLVLFVRGDADALARSPAAAIVGSRTPTPYGDDAARTLAHEACVAAGTPTVAVLAGGLDAIYPPEHHDLAERIVGGGGCLISELPPGNRARRGHFVRRNRILAGATAATIVIEASLASGALHTARFAAECGADVFALPGPWQSERSQGCHRLISEGALLIESPDALLQALGLHVALSPAQALALAANAEEERLLGALAHGPRPTDLLARESGLERGAFLRALFGLEQKAAITRLPGDLWRRATAVTSR